MANCPHCRAPINSTAIVDAFNEPAAWQFWGTEGQRWIVCKGAAYVHFRVNVEGRQQHRLAIIHGMAQDWIATERAAAEKNGDLLGASRNHVSQPDTDCYAKQEDWLGD